MEVKWRIQRGARKAFEWKFGTLGWLALIAVLGLISLAPARAKEESARGQFTYAGGTEKMPADTAGVLEVTDTALMFRSPLGSFSIPYQSIERLQYRPDVSRDIWKMKLKWKVIPREGGRKKDRYFTILYRQGGRPHVLVLGATLDVMRPYLAEIDLKSGRRVEVWEHQEYP